MIYSCCSDSDIVQHPQPSNVKTTHRNRSEKELIPSLHVHPHDHMRRVGAFPKRAEGTACFHFFTPFFTPDPTHIYNALHNERGITLEVHLFVPSSQVSRGCSSCMRSLVQPRLEHWVSSTSKGNLTNPNLPIRPSDLTERYEIL